jgi:two-component sensor histidine kinase
MAPLLHELTANGPKHGSLSVADGHLDLQARSGNNRIQLVWREISGPQPSSGPTSGSGSRLEKELPSALNATIGGAGSRPD